MIYWLEDPGGVKDGPLNPAIVSGPGMSLSPTHLVHLCTRMLFGMSR